MKKTDNCIQTEHLEIRFVTEELDDVEKKKLRNAHAKAYEPPPIGGYAPPASMDELGIRKPETYILLRPAGGDAPFARIDSLDISILETLFTQLKSPEEATRAFVQLGTRAISQHLG